MVAVSEQASRAPVLKDHHVAYAQDIAGPGKAIASAQLVPAGASMYVSFLSLGAQVCYHSQICSVITLVSHKQPLPVSQS
jgi:hypothetical protein